MLGLHNSMNILKATTYWVAGGTPQKAISLLLKIE